MNYTKFPKIQETIRISFLKKRKLLQASRTGLQNSLLQEDEEDCHYEAEEGGDVVPVKGFSLEEDHH